MLRTPSRLEQPWCYRRDYGERWMMPLGHYRGQPFQVPPTPYLLELVELLEQLRIGEQLREDIQTELRCRRDLAILRHLESIGRLRAMTA